MVTDHDLQIAIQDLVRRYEGLCSMGTSTKAVIAYAAFVSGREKLIECVGRDALKPTFNKAIDKAAERQRPQTMPIFPFLLANPIAVVHQQAVGHGGFHTGALGLDRPYVRWVYDCGAWRHVGKQALNRCISDYAEKVSAADRSVDLLFLSHFDVDHVSGVSDLLKKVRVDTVVVPYLEPAAAFAVLAEAVAQERWSSELSRAVLDTIRWLSSFGVRRVVRLRAAVSEGPEGPGVPEGPRPGEPDGASDGDRPLRPVLIGPDGQPLAPTRPHRGRGASIIEAEAGSAFAVRSGANWADWSFLPYVHRISPEARRRLEAGAVQRL